MAANKNSAYFQELTEQEKISKLSLLARSDVELTVWEKGQAKKEKLQPKEFNFEQLRLVCFSASGASFAGKKVLYSFEINGLSFFGKGELNDLGKTTRSLHCQESLYKSERRTTFRLLTFPHHKVFLQLKVDQEELKQSNVIGIGSGLSQTGLFKNFLRLIEDKSKDTPPEGYARFRALDLSVTGAAFQVGELEAKFFPKGAKTGRILLEFNGKQEAIPNGEIVYNVELLQKNKRARIYKIGLRFEGVDLNLDQALGKLINSALRDFDSEFEDYIE